jgi:2-oxoisovalerate dehydrogenase E1 component alpha subunit
MTSFGEHACIVGSAAALKAEDLVYTQYREQGAHIWRGFTIENIINQCIGNIADAGKGRQMPVHYGSKQLNNVTVSSPLSKFSTI